MDDDEVLFQYDKGTLFIIGKEWREASNMCDVANEVSGKKEKNDSESNKQFDQLTERSFGTACKYSI